MVQGGLGEENPMRRLVVCLSLTVFAIVGLQVHTASATTKIKASRSQLAKSCAKLADSSCYNCQGTSGVYGCFNHANGCFVECDTKGNCESVCKPARTAPAKGVYGVPTGGGQLAQPGTPSSRPPKPVTGQGALGGGILDGGSGFGTQGPAATGAPLGGAAPPRPQGGGRVN
jgi:hypothetical protein